jgi:hypothetical protein
MYEYMVLTVLTAFMALTVLTTFMILTVLTAFLVPTLLLAPYARYTHHTPSTSSSSTAAIVAIMCQLVVKELSVEKGRALEAGDGAGGDRTQVHYKTHRDVQRFATAEEKAAVEKGSAAAAGGKKAKKGKKGEVAGEGVAWAYEPTEWKELCGRVLYTCYMAR